MAKVVLKDVYVGVNSVDVSNQCREVTIDTDRDEVEVTGFGAENKEYMPGLGDGTITLDMLVDYGAAAIDGTFWPLSKSDTPFPVEIRPTSAVVSPTNPGYEMSGLMYGFSPIAGAVGEAATSEVPIRNASQAGITRVTS